MNKKYIYLTILVLVTVFLTLMLSALYKAKVSNYSYASQKLNQITSKEFNEYMVEHSDVIIYISDSKDFSNNKFEKKLIANFEKHNLLDSIIYIDKSEFDKSLKESFYNNYEYKYNKNQLPVIILVNDGKKEQVSFIDENSIVEEIIDYEVFKW